MIQKILIISFIFALSTLNAQSFGFGCLGLSGVYGGYTWQKYEAQGLNSHLNSIISGDETDLFGEAKGFRVGANIFRASFSSFFLTMKGFYQFLQEEHQVEGNVNYLFSALKTNPSADQNFSLKLDYWGFGLDFGIPLMSFLDLKIVDTGISILNTKFTYSYTDTDGNLIEENYKEPKTTIGYYISSGLVFHVVKDYISLEGTYIYHNFKINSVNNSESNSNIPFENSELNFINKGGFGATVQLNLGVPL